MRIINKLVKFFSLLGIHLLVILQMYVFSILCTGSILSIVNAIYSAVKGCILFVNYPFWIVLLLGSIPLGIVFSIIVETDLFKKILKYY